MKSLLMAAIALSVQRVSGACSGDNCLRGLRGAAGAFGFCSSYLAPGFISALPAFASPCSAVPSRLSSACSCLGTSTTTSSARTSSTSTTSATSPSSSSTFLTQLSSSGLCGIASTTTVFITVSPPTTTTSHSTTTTSHTSPTTSQSPTTTSQSTSMTSQSPTTTSHSTTTTSHTSPTTSQSPTTTSQSTSMTSQSPTTTSQSTSTTSHTSPTTSQSPTTTSQSPTTISQSTITSQVTTAPSTLYFTGVVPPPQNTTRSVVRADTTVAGDYGSPTALPISTFAPKPFHIPAPLVSDSSLQLTKYPRLFAAGGNNDTGFLVSAVSINTTESILNLEAFSANITSISCSPSAIVITLPPELALVAEQTWIAPFYLATSTLGFCAEDEYNRTFFSVSNVSFDDSKFQATLTTALVVGTDFITYSAGYYGTYFLGEAEPLTKRQEPVIGPTQNDPEVGYIVDGFPGDGKVFIDFWNADSLYWVLPRTEQYSGDLLLENLESGGFVDCPGCGFWGTFTFGAEWSCSTSSCDNWIATMGVANAQIISVYDIALADGDYVSIQRELGTCDPRMTFEIDGFLISWVFTPTITFQSSVVASVGAHDSIYLEHIGYTASISQLSLSLDLITGDCWEASLGSIQYEKSYPTQIDTTGGFQSGLNFDAWIGPKVNMKLQQTNDQPQYADFEFRFPGMWINFAPDYTIASSRNIPGAVYYCNVNASFEEQGYLRYASEGELWYDNGNSLADIVDDGADLVTVLHGVEKCVYWNNTDG